MNYFPSHDEILDAAGQEGIIEERALEAAIESPEFDGLPTKKIKELMAELYQEAIDILGQREL